MAAMQKEQMHWKKKLIYFCICRDGMSHLFKDLGADYLIEGDRQ